MSAQSPRESPGCASVERSRPRFAAGSGPFRPRTAGFSADQSSKGRALPSSSRARRRLGSSTSTPAAAREAELRGRTAQLDAHWRADAARRAPPRGLEFWRHGRRVRRPTSRSRRPAAAALPWFRPRRALGVDRRRRRARGRSTSAACCLLPRTGEPCGFRRRLSKITPAAAARAAAVPDGIVHATEDEVVLWTRVRFVERCPDAAARPVSSTATTRSARRRPSRRLSGAARLLNSKAATTRRGCVGAYLNTVADRPPLRPRGLRRHGIHRRRRAPPLPKTSSAAFCSSAATWARRPSARRAGAAAPPPARRARRRAPRRRRLRAAPRRAPAAGGVIGQPAELADAQRERDERDLDLRVACGERAEVAAPTPSTTKPSVRSGDASAHLQRELLRRVRDRGRRRGVSSATAPARRRSPRPRAAPAASAAPVALQVAALSIAPPRPALVEGADRLAARRRRPRPANMYCMSPGRR